jgi:hypothetical protein
LSINVLIQQPSGPQTTEQTQITKDNKKGHNYETNTKKKLIN